MECFLKHFFFFVGCPKMVKRTLKSNMPIMLQNNKIKSFHSHNQKKEEVLNV